ncbi:MAG: ABC transporter ATP-binding protein [Lachnospirales bacterium]
MLVVKNLVKKFGEKEVLNNINYTFERGKVYGLIGINGAGKSTLLRIMAGIYKATSGVVAYNGYDIYDSEEAKKNIFYIVDENPPLVEDTIKKYILFFEAIYGKKNEERYEKLKNFFEFNEDDKISKFSKGMKKQAFLFINLCFDMEYLLLDEAFEGIDPVIRVKLKKLLLEEVEERGITLIISSHNINELENICDNIIMLNNNKLEDNNEERFNMFKIQVAFKDEVDFSPKDFEILKIDQKGSVYTIIAKGDLDYINQYFNSLNPPIYDVFSLSAEEVMVYKVEEGKYEH